MASYTYTGKLTDFSETPFPSAQPKLWVEPEREAMTKTHALATKRIPITVASNGSFSVDLVPSADLTPPTRYRLRVEWLDNATLIGWTDWLFTALIGGGSIGDMTDGEPTNVWYSTSYPPINRSGIIWIHPVTGDVREWV